MAPYRFQYCTFWNKQIPAVVLREVNSNRSNDIWFDQDKSTSSEVKAYRRGGSFLCNLEVDDADLEKPVKGIQDLLKLESKYKGELNLNVTIPFSEYLSRRNKQKRILSPDNEDYGPVGKPDYEKRDDPSLRSGITKRY